MENNLIYRIIYYNQDNIYELYAKSLTESNLFGFLEISELIFDARSDLVVDPSEERLKAEFSDVNRIYIPAHSVIRIDEVAKEGIAKAKPIDTHKTNVSPFPGGVIRRGKE